MRTSRPFHRSLPWVTPESSLILARGATAAHIHSVTVFIIQRKDRIMIGIPKRPPTPARRAEVEGALEAVAHLYLDEAEMREAIQLVLVRDGR